MRSRLETLEKYLDRIYSEGFKVVGLKKLYLSKIEAQGFYYVHRERPFFDELDLIS